MERGSTIITGGSRGLGRALGEELARRGHRVVLVARGRDALDEAVAAIRRAGGTAHGVVADVGDPDAAARIVGQATTLAGPVDVLVQNASTLGPVPMPTVADTDATAVLRVFEVNVFGPLRLARAVVGGMRLRGRGTVVALSSDAAVAAYPGWGAYGASKAALDHFIRVQAAELEGTGVRLFSVDPGEMDTEMHAAAIPDADPSSLLAPATVARRLADALERAAPVASGTRVVLEELAR